MRISQYSPVDAADAWALHEDGLYSSPVIRRKSWPVQTPSQHDACSTSPMVDEAPSVIILSLWPQATQEQTDYYTAGYQTLYPTSRIMLLHSDSSKYGHDDWDDDTTLERLLGHSDARPSYSLDNTILLHLFGTSGAARACELLHGYRSRSGRPLNVQTVVADSEPLPSFTAALRSSQPVPSTFYVLFLAFWMSLQELIQLWRTDVQASRIHQDLENPSLLPAEARKCYIFAYTGVMLTWLQSTLPPAKVCATDRADREDECREYSIKRTLIDQKGKWTGDQERYWMGIEGAWEGR